jgi:hypothetical protein
MRFLPLKTGGFSGRNKTKNMRKDKTNLSKPYVFLESSGESK